MHDSVRIEDMGVPAVPVATEAFREAARVQASRLGRPDLDAVYVPHPIQDQSDAAITRRAERAIQELVDRLTTRATRS